MVSANCKDMKGTVNRLKSKTFFPSYKNYTGYGNWFLARFFDKRTNSTEVVFLISAWVQFIILE